MKCPKCKSDKFGSRPGEKGLVCDICEFFGRCNDDCYTGILEYLKKEL